MKWETMCHTDQEVPMLVQHFPYTHCHHCSKKRRLSQCCQSQSLHRLPYYPYQLPACSMPRCYYTHQRFHQYYHYHKRHQDTPLLLGTHGYVTNVPTFTSRSITGFLPNTRVYNLSDISFKTSGTKAALISSVAPVYHTSKITIISGPGGRCTR